MVDAGLASLFDDAEEQRAYEEFCAQQEAVERFQLDRPALVCRWRMHDRQVPLLNRHIRALSERIVQGSPLTHNMLSWVKQHVEWSLAEGSYDDPDGVLMLVIDVNGNAAMTVGSYAPLSDVSASALGERACAARAERAETGVAPEVLCAVEGGALRVTAAPDEHVCGAMTLVEQLAATCGHAVERGADPASLTGALLLVSDEHGVVPAERVLSDASEDARIVRALQEGTAKLFS